MLFVYMWIVVTVMLMAEREWVLELVRNNVVVDLYVNHRVQL